MRGIDELTLAIILNRLRSACLELAFRRNKPHRRLRSEGMAHSTRARENTRAVWLFSRHCGMSGIRRK